MKLSDKLSNKLIIVMCSLHMVGLCHRRSVLVHKFTTSENALVASGSHVSSFWSVLLHQRYLYYLSLSEPSSPTPPRVGLPVFRGYKGLGLVAVLQTPLGTGASGHPCTVVPTRAIVLDGPSKSN